MGSQLEPAIWPRNTGQRIPWIDRCQLSIPWTSNIKEVHAKPRLQVWYIWCLAAMLRDSVAADRSQKPLSMRIQFPPSNVSKWRTTNKISPRIWASQMAARTSIQTLTIGWITSSTCLVCLGIALSEIGGHFLQDILPYLVPFRVNVRHWWKRNWTLIFSFVKATQCLLSLRFGLCYRCFFREEISKMTFFFVSMVLRKPFPKALYDCKPKGEWIMAIGRQDFARTDAKCDLANQSVSRDKFVFSSGVPFEL